jgi:hypothetical protein
MPAKGEGKPSLLRAQSGKFLLPGRSLARRPELQIQPQLQIFCFFLAHSATPWVFPERGGESAVQIPSSFIKTSYSAINKALSG